MVTTRAQQAFVDCFLNRYYFNSALHNTYTDHLRFHSLNPLFSGSFRSHAFLTVWVQVNGQTIPLCGMRKSKIRTGALKLGMPSEKSARSGYYDFDSCSRSIYADYLPTSFLNPLKRQHSSPKIWLSAGKQTGPGANAIKASHPRLGEEVIFTANTARGAVARISADLGTNQIAETNAQPLELLSAVVRDAFDNVLPNIPVVFTIEEGEATFPDTTGASAEAANGKPAQRITLSTDKNGLVALRPLIGNTEGTVRIKAQALKNESGSVNTASDLTGNASFLIQAKAALDGPASFSGQIFDDKNKPLAGVKVSIARTNLSITSDEQGKFQLDNIPPGRIDLFVDGRTTNPSLDPNQPQYPSLHFEAYAVKGRNNQLAHPIYLPKLSTSPESVKTVGGTQDVILKIPGIDGFQMKVKANSVTFPDGSRVGTLIISPVTADRLPMSPPAGGAQFGIPAWTIQPAGTRFDPPIEVTLPNTRAFPAGDNIPVVQWDHDLAQYVPMGRATVSEDGAVLITDSGSGLTKAGWGGACVYDPDKCGKKDLKCSTCFKAETRPGEDCPTCVFDPAQKDDSVKPLSIGFGRVKSSIPLSGGAFEALGITAVFKAEGNLEGSVEYACCEQKQRKAGKVGLGGSFFAGAELEGRIWGWDWHYLVDGALGIYGQVKVGGQIQFAGLSYESCEEKLNGDVSAGLILSAEVYGKAEFRSALLGVDVSVKPAAVGLEGGFSFAKLEGGSLQLVREDFVTAYFRGEFEWDSRKINAFNLSKTWQTKNNAGGALTNFIKSLAN